MIVNYGRKRGGYPRWGSGQPIQQVPETKPVLYSDFSGGFDLRNSREDTPPNSSSDALDVEVTSRDRLRPAPGTTLSETLTRGPVQLVLHTSLDYTSELVMFDPPFLGVKSSGATVWTDVGLPSSDRQFGWANYGGTLVFSNGSTALFSREPGATIISVVEDGPAAHTFASFAGRIFAGASLIGGTREPLGVSWTDTSGSPTGWAQFDEQGVATGAGHELLIDDLAQGNFIVALRAMGLDFLAILLRRSIWIGRRSGVPTRPADFQSRVTGVGAVNEATCAVSRFGVLFLGDGGVYLFDGNQAQLVSEQINAQLLPLDFSNLAGYAGEFNPLNNCYYLFTPDETWVLDLERKRWYKRSMVALGASIFATQLPAVLWGQLVGNWSAQTGTWEDYKAGEGDEVGFLFLGDRGADRTLESEDYGSDSAFGTALEPYWTFSGVPGLPVNQLWLTKEIGYAYEGAGRLQFHLPDAEGDLSAVREVQLRTGARRTDVAFLEHTGLGASAKIAFLVGQPEVEEIRLSVLAQGPRIERAPSFNASFDPTGEVVTGFFTDFSNYATGVQPSGWTEVWATTLGDWLVVADALATGGKILRHTSTSNVTTNENLLAWTDLGQSTTQEIIARVRKSPNGVFVGAVTQANTAASEQDYGIRVGSTNGGIYEGLGVNSITSLTNVSGFVPAADTWYWVRLRSNGGVVQGKIWSGALSAEPVGWQVSFTDASPRSAGSVGVWMEAFAVAGRTADVDVFGADLTGGTAPGQPPIPGWIVPPGGYHIYVSEVPTGYKLNATATDFSESGGVVKVDLAAAPATISVKDSDGVVLGTIAAPTDRRAYRLNIWYT